MSLPKLKVGCDPELFLREKETGNPVSAHGLLPGTKKEPNKVDCGAIQIDGTAVEFNIDPAETKVQWMGNIDAVLAQIRLRLPDNVELVDAPTAIFDPGYFAALPPEAREMGCDPDYNAYTNEMNERPKTDKPMRTAGGHVHIGFTEDRDIQDPDLIADAQEVVKQLDFYLGLPSLEWDSDTQRRKLYGKAGACRYKPYGVEYRPLSCRWVLDPLIRGFVFDATIGAVNDLFTGNLARQSWGEEYAKYRLNNPQKDLALLGRWDRPSYCQQQRVMPFFGSINGPGNLDNSFYELAKKQFKFPEVHTGIDPAKVKVYQQALVPNLVGVKAGNWIIDGDEF